MKEELVLDGPQAPCSYDFVVTTSPDLSVKETPEGGIAFSESSGATWVQFKPPYVFDGSYGTNNPLQGLSTEAVTLKIVSSSPQLLVRLSVEQKWLADPARKWPVTIDPTLSTLTGSDTFITFANGAANSNFASNPSLAVDAEWLAELLEHGLLRGSFVPPEPIRELRYLTRYRKRLVLVHPALA